MSPASDEYLSEKWKKCRCGDFVHRDRWPQHFRRLHHRLWLSRRRLESRGFVELRFEEDTDGHQAFRALRILGMRPVQFRYAVEGGRVVSNVGLMPAQVLMLCGLPKGRWWEAAMTAARDARGEAESTRRLTARIVRPRPL